MTFRYLSVCSGIEAASVAWKPLGWQCAGVSEIEKFPRAVLEQRLGAQPVDDDHRYREGSNTIPLFGDFTKIEAHHVGPIDLLVGGTPCFPAGTRIATRRGLTPIEEVEVGDEVLTHEGRWQKVLRWGSKTADTIVLHGQGQSSGIETTPNHPFYACEKRWTWVGRENGNRRVDLSDPEWTSADGMTGKLWASPTVWPASKPPKITSSGREKTPPPFSDELAYVIGRWLGDGWTRINDRRGYAIICCADSEADFLEGAIEASGLHASRSKERTTTRFQIANRAFARWLHENFGSGADKKTIPTWVFGWNFRRSLLNGYIGADGCRTGNGWRISTISDALALGSVLLAHSLGYSATRRLVATNRSSCSIEGRSVNERPFYQITLYEKSRSSMERKGHRWGLVRKQSAGRRTTVFNIEVEEDNSYVADGIVVHNCQSFSVAGKRLGLDDPRGNLTLEFLALAKRVRPTWIVWENVPGVLSHDEGRTFGTFLGLLGECGFDRAAWRILDAQHVRTRSFGRAVPQRRRRLFLVGYSGTGGIDPRAVLFDRESLRGNPAPRREAGQGVAPTLAARTRGGGGLGTDFDLDGGQTAIQPEEADWPASVAPTLNAAFGEKQGLEDQHIRGGQDCSSPPVANCLTSRMHKGINTTLDEGQTLIPTPGGGFDEGNVPHALKGEGFDASEDGTGRGTPLVPVQHPPSIAGTLKSCGGKSGLPNGAEEADRMVPVAYQTSGNCGAWETGSITGALDTNTDPNSHVLCFSAKDHGGDAMNECSPTLRAGGHDGSHANAGVMPAVAFKIGAGAGAGAGSIGAEEECAPTLGAAESGTQRSPGLLHNWRVRRLTPTECERLQGFPDNWAKIEWRGKPADQCPDGPQYRAYGNSMATNVMEWIGERIEAVRGLG